MTTITLCPRCKTKYVDTTEEILCDSCADVLAQDEREQELADLTEETSNENN